MTAGKVEIEQNEVFTQDTKILPAVENAGGTIDNVVTKTIDVTNNGTESAYIRTILLSEKDGDALVNKVYADGVTFEKLAETVEYDGGEYVVYYYTYPAALAAGATTGDSLVEIYLDETADNQWYTDVEGKYELYAFSQAVQSAGFDGPAEGADYALNEAFGEITKTNVESWIATAGLFA